LLPGLKSTFGRLSLSVRVGILLFAGAASAATVHVEVPSGTDLEIRQFHGDSATALLWLPSERGMRAAHDTQAQALARLGHSVWLADLHKSYFVEPGRASIRRFPVDDIVALIDAALVAAGGELILVGDGRGAQLILIAAREWQLRNPGNGAIRGIILSHAHLYDARPEPGTTADYLPIVAATNLPVYLIAAQYSTKFSRLQELARLLGSNDNPVYTQVLSGVQGGFVTRDDVDSNAADRAAKRKYANTLSNAAARLRQNEPSRHAVKSAVDTRRFGQFGRAQPVLAAVTPPRPAPTLRLQDLDGADFALNALRDQVVLVNFWASWCRPCVTEIPSLHRLEAALADTDFRIVTVNVGEDRARVSQFLRQVTVELPVLMDYDGRIAKDWMIYVYPSSYLVDYQGKIRYAYLGALQWDSIENLRIIRSLLSER
jgi:thiol-disulfide isomerase/thioredoxin